jgi:hypothetical protein
MVDGVGMGRLAVWRAVQNVVNNDRLYYVQVVGMTRVKEDVMRALAFGGVLVACLIVAVPAYSVELRNCDRYSDYWPRTNCLNRNTKSVNSSFEIVARELRKAVADLQKEVEELKKQVGTKPDLSNYVKYGDGIQLRSRQNFSGPGKCIDQRTNPDPTSRPDRVSAADCTAEPAQRWNVAR